MPTQQEQEQEQPLLQRGGYYRSPARATPEQERPTQPSWEQVLRARPAGAGSGEGLGRSDELTTRVASSSNSPPSSPPALSIDDSAGMSATRNQSAMPSRQPYESPSTLPSETALAAAQPSAGQPVRRR